jgi:hypothetical protein
MSMRERVDFRTVKQEVSMSHYQGLHRQLAQLQGFFRNQSQEECVWPG